MELIVNRSVLNLIGVLVALIVAWTLLRAVLRLTRRIFTLGCMLLVIGGAVLTLYWWLA